MHGYEQWGDAVLDRLQGMFAFALWDARRRRLLAARDRMGKKPFYFAQMPRAGPPPLFAFASELKGLLPVPGLQRGSTRRRWPGTWRSSTCRRRAPSSAGARKLDAGEQAGAGPGRRPARRARRSRATGTCPFPPQHPRWRAEDAADGAAHAAAAGGGAPAGGRRAAGRLPLGRPRFVVGGGGDGRAGRRRSDQDLLDRVLRPVVRRERARAGGGPPPGHRSPRGAARCPRACWTVLPEVAGFLDEPLADASIIPTYLLSRFTRQHVTVALGGDGGRRAVRRLSDLPGRPARRAVLRSAARAPRGRWLVRGGRPAAGAAPGYFSLDFKVHQFLRGGPRPGPARHQRWLASFLPEELPDAAGAGPGPGRAAIPWPSVDARAAGSPARARPAIG